MRHAFLNPIRGVLILIVLSLNSVFCSLLILFVGLITQFLPIQCLRQFGMQHMQNLAALWMMVNAFVLKINLRGKWNVVGADELDPKGWYLLIANHQTWFDIIALGAVFSRKLPLIKFFMKKELLWTLPLAGLTAYLLGFPFMARHTRAEIRKNPELKGKDIETTQRACLRFKENPSTIMNFVEGTRFSEEKRSARKSPYQYLLKPKAGGLAIVLYEMQDYLRGVVDVTIHYAGDKISFWELVCGNVKNITFHYDVLPIEKEMIGNYYEERQFRSQFQRWLNTRWEQKDTLLRKLNTDESENNQNRHA